MRITKHAEARIRERNIPINQLTELLKHGKCYVHKTDVNKRVFIDTRNNVYAVTDKEFSVLITVFRKEY